VAGSEELVEIRIETSDQGPFVEDVEWVLVFADGGEARFPQGAVDLARLQELPGFDNDAVIGAMQCTDNRTFVVWRKARRS
jgi:hypothetical protein